MTLRKSLVLNANALATVHLNVIIIRRTFRITQNNLGLFTCANDSAQSFTISNDKMKNVWDVDNGCTPIYKKMTQGLLISVIPK